MITKLQIEHWDQNYNVEVFRPSNHLSGYAQTFPPGYRNIQDVFHRLRGPERQKHILKAIMLILAAYVFETSYSQKEIGPLV